MNDMTFMNDMRMLARRLGFNGSKKPEAISLCQPDPDREVSPMHYKAKNIVALQMILGGWPDGMPVEVDADIDVSAKTVGELRKVTVWSASLAITTPPGGSPEEAIKVSKASHATRLTPKP
jgi:hypothetical protein